MLFLSLVFLGLGVFGLLKGKLFYKLRIELGEETIKKQTIDNYTQSKDLGIKVLISLPIMLIYIVVYLVYLTKAVYIDPLVYPTFIMLLTYILTTVFNFAKGNKTPDLKIEENLIKYKAKMYKKRTFVGFVKSLMAVAYFSYMIYVLVF